MKVNLVNNIQQISEVSRPKKTKPAQRKDRPDRAEISREAKKLAKTIQTLSPERLREIHSRISSGYYDREDVIKEVAARILKNPGFKTILNSPGFDKNF